VKNGLNALARKAARTLGRAVAEPAPQGRASLCADPAELYQSAARDLIATVLAPWLARNQVTPFELLHRPDLAEKLERSGVDMQHAIQKVAVPAALARNVGVHEMVRDLQRVTDRAMGRLMTERKAGRLPTASPEGFADLCAALADDPDRAFRLRAGVAAALAPADTWEAKLDRLLDLFAGAPADGQDRALALSAIEPPLQELLRAPAAIVELIGADRELGETILGLTAIAHGEAVALVRQAHPALAQRLTTLSPAASRLARAFDAGEFRAIRQALSDQILQLYKSRRRLIPDDAAGELELLRTIAACLTAAGGAFMPTDDVRAAVVERSRLLVEPAFLTDLLGDAPSPPAELAAVISMLENVVGDANRRRAMRWIESTFATRRLEDRWDAEPEAKLEELARLYHRIERAGAGVTGVEGVLESIGQLGGRIQSAHHVVQAMVEGLGRREKKLEWLERMACAETAPPGPAVEEAAAALRRLA
jgi:hypothetical protein